jgi:hypothetical protein
MNASLLFQVFSNMDLSGTGIRLLCFAVALLLPLSVAAILWALRHAPEGYEDETGFHFKESRSPRRTPAAGAILHPQSAN